MSTLKCDAEDVNGAKAARARPYHFGNLREALIETSLEVIAEGGLKALTLREIGDRVGVSRAAPYRHFADKGELLAALGEAGFRMFAEVLEKAAGREKGCFAKLEEMGVAYVRFALENRAHFEVMFGGGGRSANLTSSGLEVAARSFGVLVEAVQEGQKTGKIVGRHPEPVANFIWSAVHGISLLGLETDAAGRAEFTRQCVRNLRSGIQRKT